MLSSESRVKIRTSTKEDDTLVSVTGDFSYDAHQVLRKTYENLSKEETKTVLLDLNDVDVIDSSIFGMLIIMRDYLKTQGIEVKIISASDVMQQMIETCNFDDYLPTPDFH